MQIWTIFVKVKKKLWILDKRNKQTSAFDVTGQTESMTYKCILQNAPESWSVKCPNHLIKQKQLRDCEVRSLLNAGSIACVSGNADDLKKKDLYRSIREAKNQYRLKLLYFILYNHFFLFLSQSPASLFSVLWWTD